MITYSLNKIFIYFSISIIVGIFLNNLLNSLTASFIVLLILIVLFFNFYLYVQNFFYYLLFIILGLLIGFLASYINLNNIINKEKILNKYLNENSHILKIQIIKTYSIQENNIEYVGKILNINGNNISKNIYGLFYIPKNYSLKKGNLIQFNTKIINIENIDNFEYKKYMLTKNIYIKSYIYSFDNIKNIKLNFLELNIVKIREFFINTIKKIYPKEEALFLGGILIGARENIPKDLKNDFNNSGLTHIIAVSGFNITILIFFLSILLKYLPIYIKSVIITIFIILFALIVGEGASVIRASIMGIIGYNIMISGRKGNILAIMCLTALIMILYSPLSINYDISMHLSFLAVIGIIFTQKFFSKIFYFLPNFLEIKNAFILTLSALSFTFPIIFFNFGQLSIISPIANIIVGWTIPISMFFGFISIFVYYVSNIFGISVGYITWIFLKWDILVIHFFGKQDWAILKYDFGYLSNFIEIVYFISLIFLIIYFRKKESHI